MKIQEEAQSEYVLMQELRDCNRTTRCLFASKDLLISGNFDNKVNVYQLSLKPPKDESSESGVVLPRFELVKSFDIFDSFVYSVSYCPQKSLLAVGCKSGSIYVLGLDSDFMQILSDAHAKAVCSLSFSLDQDQGTLLSLFIY
jgi:WD40 repeat protein